MVLQSLELPVAQTACRPSFLPLFVLGRNNLNPRLTITDGGLDIKIVRTTRLGWENIIRLDVRQGLSNTYAVITHNGWDYILHFHDLTGLQALVSELRSRGVKLTESAESMISSKD